ncbi:MAG: FeoB-associated Cys-rich membrane protein [Clostridiales bacterium]|jgi:hypothetical protein|nr:FeoB-associated Cys-rich membrane protein [Clostridiales bacterium]
MLAFISENLGTIIVGAVVLAVLILVVMKLIRDKRSITCSCGDCSGCGSYGICSMNKKEVKSDIKPSEIKIKRIK